MLHYKAIVAYFGVSGAFQSVFGFSSKTMFFPIFLWFNQMSFRNHLTNRQFEAMMVLAWVLGGGRHGHADLCQWQWQGKSGRKCISKPFAPPSIFVFVFVFVFVFCLYFICICERVAPPSMPPLPRPLYSPRPRPPRSPPNPLWRSLLIFMMTYDGIWQVSYDEIWHVSFICKPHSCHISSYVIFKIIIIASTVPIESESHCHQISFPHHPHAHTHTHRAHLHHPPHHPHNSSCSSWMRWLPATTTTIAALSSVSSATVAAITTWWS